MTSLLEKRVAEKRALEKNKKPSSPSMPVSPGVELAGLMANNNKDPDAIIVSVDDIIVSEQVRKEFTQQSLEELADDIAAHGQDTPIIIRSIEQGRYELVAGERRIRAKRILQERDPSNLDHKMIRATVKTLNDEQKENRQLAENIHREDLKPLELAKALAKQKETYGYTDEQLSQHIKKERSFITRHLGLLNLSPELQYLVSTGEVKVTPAIQKKDAMVRKVVSEMPSGLQARIEKGELSTLEALQSRDSFQEHSDSTTDETSSGNENAQAKPEKQQRQVKVSVPLSSAEAMADLLAELAADLNLNPVSLTKQKGKVVRKELIALLETRVEEVFQAYRTRNGNQ